MFDFAESGGQTNELHPRHRARKVKNLIDFKQNWLSHIMPNQFEAVMIEQVLHILASPVKQLPETKNFVAVWNQSIAQMRAEMACD